MQDKETSRHGHLAAGSHGEKRTKLLKKGIQFKMSINKVITPGSSLKEESCGERATRWLAVARELPRDVICYKYGCPTVYGQFESSKPKLHLRNMKGPPLTSRSRGNEKAHSNSWLPFGY